MQNMVVVAHHNHVVFIIDRDGVLSRLDEHTFVVGSHDSVPFVSHYTSSFHWLLPVDYSKRSFVMARIFSMPVMDEA